ncbi:MAG TPA: sugar porter family MFS transporter [Opitutaceae bacterium]|nr:sugar porter family MFS transporter [Opitutaceae bacterium]
MSFTPVAVSPADQPQVSVKRLYLWSLSLVAALGGLLFGYDWVVIGGAAKFYEAYFQLAQTAGAAADAGVFARLWASLLSPIGWAQSCALLGCLLGALISGVLSDRYGRKPMLLIAGANFAVASLGNALAGSFGAFVAWRIFSGVSIGLASNISPMYISEIAPARIRGLLVAVNQLTIVLGVLGAQAVNWLIAEPVPAGLDATAFVASWNVQTGWRWMFAACAVPSLVFFICGWFVPESPRWLAARGRRDRATSILARIGGSGYATTAIAAIDAAHGGDAQEAPARFAALFDPRLRRVLTLGVVLAVFQQWCGINVIFNYAGEIFQRAGYDLNDTLTSIVMTGVVNLVFTVAALVAVDRLGRKPLLLFGAAALAVVYVAIGFCFQQKAGGVPVPNTLFLGLVLSAIASYAMSLAPVTWVVISEIFPNRIRGTAMSFAVGCLWIACFLLTYTFPVFNSVLGPHVTFWIYAGICLCGFLFVWRRLPETKGRTLEQIEASLTS